MLLSAQSFFVHRRNYLRTQTCTIGTFKLQNLVGFKLRWINIGQGWSVAQLVVRWPAVWQARAQIPDRHPREVFPSKQNKQCRKGERPWRMDINECTVWMWLLIYEKDEINKKSGSCHQSFKILAKNKFLRFEKCMKMVHFLRICIQNLQKVIMTLIILFYKFHHGVLKYA
jgi:hypothetical protein